MEYIFTLKYRLPADEVDMDALVERLGDAGCTDAIIGTGLPGRLAIEFTREAASAEVAMRSALDDVRGVIPAADLIEASPDVVGLTDVATLTGVSRQNMRKLMVAHAGDFPAPMHDGSSSLWHLADLLAWLATRQGYAVDAGVLETSAAAMRVNIAKENARLAHTP
jgi:predicted DNA-binding transcriptional regulator AlpA